MAGNFLSKTQSSNEHTPWLRTGAVLGIAGSALFLASCEETTPVQYSYHDNCVESVTLGDGTYLQPAPDSTNYTYETLHRIDANFPGRYKMHDGKLVVSTPDGINVDRDEQFSDGREWYGMDLSNVTATIKDPYVKHDIAQDKDQLVWVTGGSVTLDRTPGCIDPDAPKN